MKTAIDTQEALQKLVKELSDGTEWNWIHMSSDRDAADQVLSRMAELGLIRHEIHPLGGHIWIINGQMFGRTDGVTYKPRGRKTKICYRPYDPNYHLRRGRVVREKSSGKLKRIPAASRVQSCDD